MSCCGKEDSPTSAVFATIKDGYLRKEFLSRKRTQVRDLLVPISIIAVVSNIVNIARFYLTSTNLVFDLIIDYGNLTVFIGSYLLSKKWPWVLDHIALAIMGYFTAAFFCYRAFIHDSIGDYSAQSSFTDMLELAFLVMFFFVSFAFTTNFKILVLLHMPLVALAAAAIASYPLKSEKPPKNAGALSVHLEQQLIVTLLSMVASTVALRRVTSLEAELFLALAKERRQEYSLRKIFSQV